MTIARKVLQATIKTVDDNNHIRIWTEKDIDSLIFTEDKKKNVKDDSKITKQIKKIIAPKEKNKK